MSVVTLYPFATVFDRLEHGVAKFNPAGITIHYTAGGSVSSTVGHLRSQNLRYHLIIDRAGICHQLVYLNSRVYHAGVAEWLGNSPNRSHIAIALASYGTLAKKGSIYYTAYGKTISDEFVSHRPALNGALLYWEKASDAQISSLEKACLWLCKTLAISPKHVCGHDEAAPTRKIDPGGVLPYSMQSFRDSLHEKLLSP